MCRFVIVNHKFYCLILIFFRLLAFLRTVLSRLQSSMRFTTCWLIIISRTRSSPKPSSSTCMTSACVPTGTCAFHYTSVRVCTCLHAHCTFCSAHRLVFICLFVFSESILNVERSPLRFDSWAGMALARASRIQEKLNSNELKSDVPIWKHSQAVLNCFKRALEIDSSNLSLWIEYGTMSYALHSFASRQLKQWRNELPPEVIKQVRCVSLICFSHVRSYFRCVH